MYKYCFEAYRGNGHLITLPSYRTWVQWSLGANTRDTLLILRIILTRYPLVVCIYVHEIGVVWVRGLWIQHGYHGLAKWERL
jgi:hypothetical protein